MFGRRLYSWPHNCLPVHGAPLDCDLYGGLEGRVVLFVTFEKSKQMLFEIEQM